MRPTSERERLHHHGGQGTHVLASVALVALIAADQYFYPGFYTDGGALALLRRCVIRSSSKSSKFIGAI